MFSSTHVFPTEMRSGKLDVAISERAVNQHVRAVLAKYASLVRSQASNDDGAHGRIIGFSQDVQRGGEGAHGGPQLDNDHLVLAVVQEGA